MRSVSWIFVVILASVSTAEAHTADGLAGGALSGFLHPLKGLDHLVAMVAVGLWGAQLGRPLVFVLPVVFPMVMALGGLMGIAALPLPAVELGIALSAVCLGLAVAFAWRAPVVVASVLVALFAVFHGYAHGVELPTAVQPLAYGIGFVVATGLLHLVGIGFGLLHDRPKAGPYAVRAGGAAIAALGAWFTFGAIGAVS